jgi:hypothetical protein
MSTFVNLPSVCGATSASVDVYDLDLNPHGVICCDNCKSIVLCRKAWDFLYKEPLERHDFQVIDYNELEIA